MERSIDEKRVEELVAQVPADATDELLYAGLAVLARDMYQYLQKKNLLDNNPIFKQAVDAVTKEEEELNLKAFPKYNGLDISDLPTNLTEKAAGGQQDLSPLLTPEIIHEWTFKAGKRFFDKFTSNFRDTICGPNGPYSQFNKPSFNNAVSTALAVAVAGAISTAAPITYPLAVYCGFLLARNGLKTYCPKKPPHS